MSNWDYILSASQKGWECPRCGRINAPWLPCCSCDKTDITWTNNTSTTTSPSYYDDKIKKSFCGAYHYLNGRAECWGTKDKEKCTCNGDKNKCNFY